MRPLRSLFLLAALALAGSAAASAAPDSAPPARGGELAVQAARLLPGERLVLDGSLSHAAWQRAPAHGRFVEHAPRNGSAPPQRTQVQLLFDEQAVYIGITAFDDRPHEIRDVPVRYDGVNRTQDFVVAYLDPIGHKASAQFFRVNAAGSIADGIHTAADDSEDFSPDFDWDAAVQRRADGWTAVLRIPFASLRFAEPLPGQPARPWRFMVARRLPREQFHLVTSVELPRGSPSFIDRLQPLLDIELPEQHAFLTLRPTLTLRRTEQRSPGGGATRESHHEAGLNLKWRPRAELVVDATIKPDFSQVELDVPQLSGNSRFALYLPEKRPFFFESADLLRTPTEAFYTRSITQPRAGLRATWRSASWQGTALAAEDIGNGLVLLPGPFGTDFAEQPGSRVYAGRLRRGGGAASPTVGALFASRDYEQGRGANRVLGGDVEAAFGDHWRLRAQLLASRTTARAVGSTLQAGPAEDGRRLFLRLQRDTAHSGTALALDDISPGFRHDTGFVNQAGIRSAGLHQAWKWHDVGPFNNFDLFVDARDIRDTVTGQTIDRWVYAGFWSTAARNLEWWLEVHPRSTVRTRPTSGLLTQRFVSTGLVMTPAPWFAFLDASLNIGRLADAVADRTRPGANLRLSARLRPLRSVELDTSLSHARLIDEDTPTRRPAYRESAAQVLGIWHLDARHHLRLIVQRRSLERLSATGVTAQDGDNLSLTWHWRRSAGTQLFVGASRQREGAAAGPRTTEAFVKLQLDAAEWPLRW